MNIQNAGTVFRYDKLVEHPSRVFDGVLPFKIKDEVVLKDWVHAMIVPENYKREFESIISEEIQSKVHYIQNDCKDIWQWSEKVYEFARMVWVAGMTPDLTTEEIRKTKRFSKVKADEILMWLKNHPETKKWVVIDDLELHNNDIAKHQVMTDPEQGLTEDDVEKVLEILRG